jgi:GT2 family glycosyltransferase
VTSGGYVISILMVTYNAPRHVARSLLFIRRRTKGVPFEVVVVDNDSKWPTRLIVTVARWFGMVNRLALLDRNTLFAEGCNIAAAMSPRDSEYVLLMNSDTEPKRADWLKHLLELHKRGATAYGFVEDGPLPRADGYCLLIDRDLFLNVGMDEAFAWWWSATRLQAQLLQQGHSVQGVADHANWLVHEGGASGKAWRGARGMDTSADEVRRWFGEHRPVRI